VAVVGPRTDWSPDWGDVPTWLAVVVATVGGGIALSQLRQQQAVIQSDIERSQKRDELLDGQLRDLAERERYLQRAQAELINVEAELIMLAGQGSPEGRGSCKVINSSSRPVRHVTCRLLLDGQQIPASDFTQSHKGPASWGSEFVPAKTANVDLAAGEYLNLLAGEIMRAGFTLPDSVTSRDGSLFVIRFTDDAGRRWELDQTMHLVSVQDGD